MARFVTVAAFDETFRADVARAALEDAGIEVRITDRELVAMEWVLATAVGGIKVQVPEADAARARGLLDAAFRDLKENGIDEDELTRQALAAAPEDDVPPPPPVEVQATATADKAATTLADDERELYARRFLLTAVFSLFFMPLFPYAIYLGLNASLGAGRLSSEGWKRVFYGGLALAAGFPLWYWLASWGVWGFLSGLVFD